MKFKKALKILLPLVLGGFLVGYSLSSISIKILVLYFKNANYYWIGIGLLFGICSHLSRAYRWKYLLQPLGYNPNFINSIMAVLVAYLVNYAIPRAGEVSRAAVMANYENIPFEKGLGTIVAERIADLLMILLIICITLFIEYNYIYQLLIKNFSIKKIAIILGVLILGIFLFSVYIKKASSGLGFKIKGFLLGLVQGVASIFKMKYKGAFILHTLFIWLMYLAMFWVTIPSIEGLKAPLGAVLTGFIAGGFSIAATNGGIGLYPIAVAGAFSLFNIADEPAKAFGWIMWTAQTAMIIVFGALSFLLLPIYNKNK
ncbi:MAG: lysylphosphatidylglycerol synthase transmembrane domain-containing protein [Tenacibaculum sp.]